MRVLVAGGGTGGHFYPALAVMEELIRRHPEVNVAYVGTRRGIEARILPSYPWIKFYPIHVRGLGRGSYIQNARSLLLLVVAFIETTWVFIRFRPHLVVGMGGYASFPPTFLGAVLGKFFRIRTVIHEQNLTAGLTNRVLARFVDKVLLSYPQTKQELPRVRQVVVTGNPIREEFLRAQRTPETYQRFGLDPERKTVLVFGGSRGSSALINALLTAGNRLANDDQLQVLLVTGDAEDENAIRTAFAAAGVTNVHVHRYIDRMGEAFAIADLIVSRAGATTLAEITSCGKPALLVPWRGAADDHQRKNAYYLKQVHGCAVAEEQEVAENGLVKLIEEMIGDEQQLSQLARNAARIGRRHAVNLILGELESLAREAHS